MIWKNGHWAEGYLGTQDHQVLGPYLYEVIKIVDGVPLFWAYHLERLKSNFSGDLSQALAELENQILGIIQKLGILEGNLKLIFSAKNDLIIGQIPHTYPTREQVESGICIQTLHMERTDPNTKVWNAQVRNAANQLIQNSGCYEIALVNRHQQITEGSRSNIFALKADQLHTPPLHQVLPGVTRRVIFDICKENELLILEKAISLNQIEEYESLFISGTSPGILPVRQFNSIQLNTQSHLLKFLQDAYQVKIKQNLKETVTFLRRP